MIPSCLVGAHMGVLMSRWVTCLLPALQSLGGSGFKCETLCQLLLGICQTMEILFLGFRSFSSLSPLRVSALDIFSLSYCDGFLTEL